MYNKIHKYHTVGKIPKLNIKIVERGKIDPLAHTYMTVHFPSLVQARQLKSGGVKLVLWAQISIESELRGRCKCFPHLTEISILSYQELYNLEHYDILIYLSFMAQKLLYV